MDWHAIVVFFVLTVVAIGLDVLISVFAIKRKTTMSRWLGFSGIACAFCVFAYLVRICTGNMNVYALMTGFYLIGLDIALFGYLGFIVRFTRFQESSFWHYIIRVLFICIALDTVFQLLNPVTYWVVGFEPRDTIVARFHYIDYTLLYWAHIALDYVFVILSIGLLLFRFVREPKSFGRQYLDTISVLVVLLVGNFLYGGFNNSLLDYSVFCYSLLIIFMYWYAFKYSSSGMLNFFKNSIFENVDQGLVLFDYHGELIFHNGVAERLLPRVNFNEDLNQKAFLNKCNITYELNDLVDVFSIQCYGSVEEGDKPLRCDFRRIKSENAALLGNLFIFSDAILETDLLTGFHNWDSFKVFAEDNSSNFSYPMTAVVCDLNNLAVINSSKGQAAGDLLLAGLANALKEEFPPGTYYVRCEDARLAVLSYDMSLDDVHVCMANVAKKVEHKFQYAIDVASSWKPSVIAAIESAFYTLHHKKLLDKSSSHSELLTSLEKTLQECDSDTEEHVKRTQRMGEALGKRIGLTDKQMCNLSLLCLLHDIGKIGIPLDILNKPGKLSTEEWNTIKTHVTKGYQIARSSKDLSEIADLILHHHERWDGKGYPDGLSRESIPLLSRVICIVDSFDAMVNNRSYRPAMTVDEAVAELVKCSGTQFDPYLVSEFLPICREMAEDVTPDSMEKKVRAKMKVEQEKAPNLNKVLHHVHDLLYSRYTLDAGNRIIGIDENFEKMTGYSWEDVQERHMGQGDLIPAEDLTEYLCLVEESIANRQMAFCEHRIKRKDGNVLYVFCLGRVAYDSAAKEVRSEIVITDSSNTYVMKMMKNALRDKALSQLKHWEETYRRDSLTDLLNHAAFKSDVEEKLLDDKFRVMLLMLDVDKFKEYNDSYGHRAGDEFLVLVAHALSSSLRGSDLACRMGGDEFAAALFFKKDCSKEFMYSRAQQIFDKIMMSVSAAPNSTGLSMGAVVADDELKTFNQLYEASDKALYSSKEKGRGCISIVDNPTETDA